MSEGGEPGNLAFIACSYLGNLAPVLLLHVMRCCCQSTPGGWRNCTDDRSACCLDFDRPPIG
jgi:hypothetical protein